MHFNLHTISSKKHDTKQQLQSWRWIHLNNLCSISIIWLHNTLSSSKSKLLRHVIVFTICIYLSTYIFTKLKHKFLQSCNIMYWGRHLPNAGRSRKLVIWWHVTATETPVNSNNSYYCSLKIVKFLVVIGPL